jgi:hypothetical protein
MRDSEGQSSSWLNVKQQRESSRSELVSQFEACGGEVRGRSKEVRCIIHDDGGKPNGSIQNYNGKWYFKCFKCSDVCMDVWDLEARARGLTVEQVLAECKSKAEGGGEYVPQQQSRPKTEPKKKGFKSAAELYDAIRSYYLNEKQIDLTPDGMYPYFTRIEEPFADYVVFRSVQKDTGVKSFTQCYKSREDSLWYRGLPPSEYLEETNGLFPLFNRKGVLETENILVVEGEKCVEAFVRLGIPNFTATTSVMGSEHFQKTYWKDLAGKNIWTWADNDSSGAAYMKSVTEDFLLKLEPVSTVKRVRHEELDLPPKGDIFDFIQREGTTTDEKQIAVMSSLQAAEGTGLTQGLRVRGQMISDGLLKQLHFPDAPRLTELTHALKPSTITLLCGDPGHGKSYWFSEKMYQFTVQGVKTATLMLEKDLDFWMTRMLAQVSGNLNVIDEDWVKTNREEYDFLINQHENELEPFLRTIWTVGTEPPTLKWVGEWVEARAAEGCEMVGVDPVTMAITGKEGYKDEHNFMSHCDLALKRHRSRLILVTHSRMEQLKTGKPSLAGLAGGMSYPRFSDTILWFKRFDKPEDSSVEIGGGRVQQMQHHHWLGILKSRNGRGAGSNLALMQDKESLGFHELGEIVEV